MIRSKAEMVKHHKSHFRKENLAYVEEEMRTIEDSLEIASVTVAEGDRVTATATIQGITELLLGVEAILLG